MTIPTSLKMLNFVSIDRLTDRAISLPLLRMRTWGNEIHTIATCQALEVVAIITKGQRVHFAFLDQTARTHQKP